MSIERNTAVKMAIDARRVNEHGRGKKGKKIAGPDRLFCADFTIHFRRRLNRIGAAQAFRRCSELASSIAALPAGQPRIISEHRNFSIGFPSPA